MIQKFNQAVAWVRNALAVVQGYYATATTYISKEPIDFGSLCLGAAAGSLLGGRYLIAAGLAAGGYYLRNTERVKAWVSGLLASADDVAK